MDPSSHDPYRSPSGPGSTQWRHWPLVAVIALVAATAGWTTVAVMVLDGRPAVGAASPSAAPGATDDGAGDLPSDEVSDPPVELSHAAPEVETLLPTTVDGIALTTESVLGSSYLGDDDWSTAVRAVLTTAKKVDDDLKIGVAYDASGDPRQLSITLYRAEGVDADALLKAMVDSYAALDPPFVISKATIADKAVTKAVASDGADDSLDIFWYVHDGSIYDVETTDDTLAGAAIAALPPVTAAPSVAPTPSSSAAPSAS